MMLYLGWIFLWLVSRERIKGFNISDCSTKKLIWTYHARSEEEFFLFCDLPELQKSHFFHRSQISPTQVPERVPCSGSKDIANVQWYLQPQNGDPLREITRDHPHIKSALHFSTIRMNDAGSYICRPRIRSTQDDACCIKMILEVKPKRNTSFSGFEHKHKQSLLLGSIDPIYCPSLHCQSDTQCPQVTWYQNGKLLSEKRGNPLRVGEIYNHHRGTYVCDYTQSANASLWIVRAVVQVETIVKNTNFKPDILEPEKDTLEAELGKPLALNCKVRFGFEKDFKPVVRWYIKDPDQEQEVPLPEGSSNTSMLKDEVIQHVLSLEEVTQNDLQRKFICFAKNSVGSTTRSIQLKNKKGAVFIYILLGTILTLVGVLLASALLYTYWIEVVLLYRTYQSKDETLGDKKEFDAFVSYAKSSSLESEVTSSPSEENLALNLLPEVLENKYGYTLCLLERDVAPGGVDRAKRTTFFYW